MSNIGRFNDSLEKGKIAEDLAINYFSRKGWSYTDVRDDVSYRNNDIDFIVENLGKVEVKLNYHNALKGRQGNFVWIEILVGENQGWWYKSKADYFLFFDIESNGVLIKNDNNFQQFINDTIKNGDHSQDGNFRYDYKKDMRANGYIIVISMRVYIEDIPEVINIYRPRFPTK